VVQRGQWPRFLRRCTLLLLTAHRPIYTQSSRQTPGRGQAALDGLRNAFSELFRRNESIYKADGAGVKDLVVEVTGLNKSDNIVRLISQTFEVIRGFADKNGSPSGDTASIGLRGAAEDSTQDEGIGDTGQRVRGIGVSYHINVVLPETENIAVFNANLRSLRDNLLREL
jgi:hypothetical protein